MMYSNKVSKFLLKRKPLIKKLIDILSNDFEYASCLVTDVKGTRIVVDKTVTNVTPTSLTESGFVVRVLGKNVYTEYSINDINEKNFNSVLEEIKKEALKNRNIEPVKTIKLDEEEITKTFIRKNKGQDYKEDEIIDILTKKVNEYVKDEIINVYSFIECNEYQKMFISKKKELIQYYTWTNSAAFAISRVENSIKEAYSGNGYPSLEEAINDLDEVFKYSTKVAKDLQKAKPPVPGIYTIITNPSITGLIAHEAFGHGVEMDMYVKDRAKSKDYIGKSVASPLITMHDGAKATLSSASYFFDDDGVLAQDTVIIDKGILKRGISDALSALELGTTPTGNGRRESYKRKSYTRMTNTFFSKGKSTLEDMIKSVDYGYYICDTNNGMEDPKNWGIQCTASYGLEIKDGKFTGNIISPVVMSGYVIDLLESISMVSNKEKVIGSGSCGKGYKEWVRVSDGGASIKARVKIG